LGASDAIHAAGMLAQLPQSAVINSFGTNADWVNRLHTAVSTLARHSVAANGVCQGASELLGRLGANETIPVLQFWGHGVPGGMEVGNQMITAASFNPGHPHYQALSNLRARLAEGASVYFRGCSTFAGEEGRAFARAAAAFFNCRVVGYTAQ